MIGSSLRHRIRNVVVVSLTILLLVSIFGVVYLSASPPDTSEPFTEFYVLNSSGGASDYPTRLEVGSSASVLLGVSNHENRDITYTVVVTTGNRTVTTERITLSDGETWEEPVTFTVREQNVEEVRFDLYNTSTPTDSDVPYRTLHLELNVTS